MKFLPFLLLFISCTSYSHEVEPVFNCSKQLDSPYGVCTHFAHNNRDYPTIDNQLSLIQNAGINNVRFDFWVPYTDTLLNHEQLRYINDAICKSVNAHLQPLGIIFGGWTGQRAWQRESQYKTFVNYLLSGLQAKVKNWEIMNEVNLTASSDKLPLDSIAKLYTNILSYTYNTIKASDINNIVTSSGLGEVNDDFLEYLCEQGAFNYFDIFNFHSYAKPEVMPIFFSKIKRLMDKYGWHKPVWITECGMPTHKDTISHFWNFPYEIKEKEQARRIPRMYIISFAYGVDKVFTFNFRARENDIYDKEENFGIVHSDLSLKPAYNAYKTMTKMLPSGSTRPRLIKKGDMYLGLWERTDGKNIWALWNSNGTRKIKLKINGIHRVINYIGEKIKIPKKDGFVLGEEVIYIIGANHVEII